MKITHRLQLVESRRGNNVYEKFQAVFPRKLILECGWSQGDELHFRRDREDHVVVSAHPYAPKLKPEADYDRIRLAVWSTLHRNPNGMRWTQIRENAPILPKKPSPFLVAKLTIDIGLRRVRDAKSGSTIWRIGEARLFPER
jgi:bifunctional DNA-binding transcriptional regulator/antitoxin component of YhaV-PrlF toxin-antitoxin module